ncbi:MAG: HipA domain-containing protein [Woeseiaceae bacterium]|nr:HipA domain-containing protein [Woeseiaceae bacterium]
MMKKTMADLSVLDVLLHGDQIGTLTLLPGDKTLFAFTESYIADSNRATLSLSFKEATTGGLITDVPPTTTKVPHFFSNLLPEGTMRDYLAERAGVKSAREFFLLWVLGQDLPGALKIVPDDRRSLPDINENEDELEKQEREDKMLRFSIAGVQLKFPAVNDATGGLTIPVKGVGGSWIVKLPSTKFEGVPENEYSMMLLAREIGIDVPDIQLIETKTISGLPSGMDAVKGHTFAIKRFDRDEENSGIHIEDFAQVFGIFPEAKYQNASYRNVAEVISVEVGEKGVVEFLRRIIFNVLIGNADMHLKNWSLIYPDRRTPALAPAYDFVSTIPYPVDGKLALNFGKSKKMADISEDSIKYFANKARLPEKLMLDTAHETVERFRTVWPKLKHDLPMHSNVTAAIEKHIETIPIAK